MTENDFWIEVHLLVEEGQRVGQAMFNVLSRAGMLPASIVGGLDDPFYRVKTMSSGRAWLARMARISPSGKILAVGT